jgi:hypothetical protein
MMRFTHSGLECMTQLSPVGIPCGYVAVPESHPDYGKHYDDMEDIEVHGGLTFSGYWENLCDGLWYFGFDCGHVYDMNALPHSEKLFDFTPFGVDHKTMLPKYQSNKTMKYVEAETERLAEQLAARSIK